MSQAQLLPSDHSSPSVTLHKGRPATTSLEVAKFFGKRHDNVVRDIKQIMDNCPKEFTALNFEVSEYTDETGRTLVMFILYRDGFMLLVMGYTGKKAMAMKIAYIEAFNAMEATLASQSAPDPLPPASVTLTASTVSDRAPLRSMVNAWSKVSGQHHDALWPQVRSAFNLLRIDQLPAEWVPDAIAWVQEKIDGAQRAIPAAPSAPVVSYAPPAHPVLSTELQRYAEDFDRLCGPVAEMERVLTQVMRLSYPLVRETTLSMCEGRLAAAEQQVARGHLEAALEEHLEHSRRMVHDIITCGRLGINVVRDLARVQGR